ncbi:two-component response regulator [Richelia intracellularis HM01]|uniref:response regulator n=1 Tax=Richelia intracellularis TaxID=1164990 RepID=UPI0002B580F9|nr:response regulator transcription factor [Richelia intracellularis]CCH65161.1 two-component response regulator [Richelia intracellularis HM01]
MINHYLFTHKIEPLKVFFPINYINIVNLNFMSLPTNLMLCCPISTIRVLIVDDHELTRLTLKLAFSHRTDIQLVGLGTNGKEAIQMVKELHPDVIILDLQMPVMDGWDASCQIKAIAPQTQIIAYSSLESKKSPETKVIGQWDAYCQKDVPTVDLINLVKKLGINLTHYMSCCKIY